MEAHDVGQVAHPPGLRRVAERVQQRSASPVREDGVAIGIVHACILHGH